MSNFNPSKSVFHYWKKDMYIATKKEIVRDNNYNEIIKYNQPFYFGKVNYQPLTSKQLEAYIQTYGETENNIVSCLIDYKDKDKFRVFDLAYLYNATPTGEVNYGDNANYIVKAFKPQNTKIMVLLEEIIKEENQDGESQN